VQEVNEKVGKDRGKIHSKEIVVLEIEEGRSKEKQGGKSPRRFENGRGKHPANANEKKD